MLPDDHAPKRDEGTGPKRRWLFEEHAHGKRIDLFDRRVPIDADRRCGCRRVRGEFPVEYDIIGSEGLAIMPLDAFFELPGHRPAISCDAAVFDVRDLGGEHRHEISI